jgi:uncharacterized phiE125 gp8 family phage protein
MIPRPPLIEVLSIEYDDEDGVEQTLATDQYYVDSVSEPGWVAPTLDGDGWPSTLDALNAVRLRFRCGYTQTEGSPSTSLLPARATTAIKSLAAFWYDNREPVVVGASVSQIPSHVTRMLRSLRIVER